MISERQPPWQLQKGNHLDDFRKATTLVISESELLLLAACSWRLSAPTHECLPQKYPPE
jgi:hypothetical protein